MSISRIGTFASRPTRSNPEVLSYPFWIRDRHPLPRWGRRAYQEIYRLQAKWRYLRSRREPGKS